MSKRKDEYDWRWPTEKRDEKKLKEKINNIPSPYEPKKNELPPMCYPGTNLSPLILQNATALLAKQINAIGSHTSIDIKDDGSFDFKDGEGGFEQVQNMEANAIWRVASVIGGDYKNVDGYFCGGGTESIQEGMWIGREWLRKTPDPKNKDIAILTTPLMHYSIPKTSEILDIGKYQLIQCPLCKRSHIFMSDPSGSGVNLVGIDDLGQMSIIELEKVFHRKYDEGFRRFMIIPTVGTCIMGSIDPVEKIGQFIDNMTRNTGASFYMHVDASFGGFTVPFVKPSLKFGFNVPQVMSVTVDADKMGRLPYPSGIFLCRKDLMKLVGRQVNYVRGNTDNTVSGSRTCLAPVLAWYLYQTITIEDQRQYVQKCIDMRDFLIYKLNTSLPWVKTLPRSQYVNFAPMVIPIDQDLKEIPTALIENKIKKIAPMLKAYHLRSDFVPKDPADVFSCPHIVYKICIMPHHTKAQMLQFIENLCKADQIWKKYKKYK